MRGWQAEAGRQEAAQGFNPQLLPWGSEVGFLGSFWGLLALKLQKPEASQLWKTGAAFRCPLKELTTVFLQQAKLWLPSIFCLCQNG